MKDGSTGFLVKPNETSKLEEYLTLLLEDDKKRKEMGRDGRKFIENNFSWNIITKQFSDIPNNLIKESS